MKNRTKLLFLMIIGVFGSLFVFFLFALLVGGIWDDGYNLNKLNRISQETVRAINEQSDINQETIQPIINQFHSEHHSIRFELINSAGNKIYDTSGDMRGYDFQKIADRFLNMPNNLWAENEIVNLAYAIEKENQTYYLFMSLPSEALKQGQVYFFVRTNQIIYILLLPLLLSIFVPYLLSLLFFSSINRRITRLNNALNQVNIQSPSFILEDNSKDELGQLTQHYNSMVERIQDQVAEIEQFENKRNQFLSNLSHDLRTPLTMILGYAETIRTGLYKNEAQLQSSAKIILQRSRYMARLLDQMLDITKQNKDALTLQLAPYNISEMIRKIIADYLYFLDGQNYKLNFDIPDTDMEAMIDDVLIERSIRNVIDNAIRYGKDGQYLGISLKETENEIWISVVDHGKGIALEDHEKIFERFYRADQGRQGEGLGIGLAIVKEVIELHNGTIDLISNPYEETIFIIKLPKAPTLENEMLFSNDEPTLMA